MVVVVVVVMVVRGKKGSRTSSGSGSTCKAPNLNNNKHPQNSAGVLNQFQKLCISDPPYNYTYRLNLGGVHRKAFKVRECCQEEVRIDESCSAGMRHRCSGHAALRPPGFWTEEELP